MTTTCDKPNAVAVNEPIAAALAKVAGLLEARSDNPFRVHAYRAAAQLVQGLTMPVSEILEQGGLDRLTQLPGVGQSLAHAIEELARTGSLALLVRLQAEAKDADPLSSLPGIGEQLATRIRQQLGIQTMEDLEAAAYDGRLRAVPGVGLKRVQAIREVLAARTQRQGPAKKLGLRRDQPPVEELLDVDRQYRTSAEKDRLPTAAPKRFNPTHAAWLPILHAERADRRYVAMYSNTARAHALAATHDWVVVMREGDPQAGQWTIVTARSGPLKGRRVVRGRETECQAYYDRLLIQAELPLSSGDVDAAARPGDPSAPAGP